MLFLKNSIETSITNEYKSEIWRKYIKAVEKYDLLKPGDKIAVCISGGMASMLLAKLMQMSAKYRIHDIEVSYIFINSGYSENFCNILMSNCLKLDIAPIIIKTGEFNIEDNIDILYREAERLGCNKIALGQHYDDITETILMSMLCGAQIQTKLPKSKSDCVQGMELIRPLYLIRENIIDEWGGYNALSLEIAKCDNDTSDEAINVQASTSAKIRSILAKLRKENSLVDSNVFGSVENISLEKIVGYQLDGEKHNFMDDYFL